VQDGEPVVGRICTNPSIDTTTPAFKDKTRRRPKPEPKTKVQAQAQAQTQAQAQAQVKTKTKTKTKIKTTKTKKERQDKTTSRQTVQHGPLNQDTYKTRQRGEKTEFGGLKQRVWRQDRGWRPEAEGVVDSRTRFGCDKYALGSRVFGSPIMHSKDDNKADQDKDNDKTGHSQDKRQRRRTKTKDKDKRQMKDINKAKVKDKDRKRPAWSQPDPRTATSVPRSIDR
jgi:hypothetical protein